MRARPLLHPLVCAVLALTLTGCGGSSGPVPLTVFAASSLTEAFTELGRVYERSQGVRLRLVFDGSLELVERLRDRQRADVLVTGDETAMRPVAKKLGPRRVIARTSMTIAVAPGNPKKILGVTDLVRPRLRVVLGSPTTPVGRYSQRLLAEEGLTVRADAEEISAPAVLTRIRTGEADAGIVYITDMRTAGSAAGSVPIPADQNVTAAFPAAALTESGQEEAAESFVAWLTSAEARSILYRQGFTV